MAISLESLIIEESKAVIYETALDIARSIGLPVDSWQAGDPTRSLYHLESELLSKLESIVVGYIRAGFLDYAAELAEAAPDDPKAQTWLKVLAEQVYNVTVTPATFAATDVVLTNNGGGFYPDIEPGDLTFKNSATGKTYRNSTGGTLASGPGTTLTLSVIADEAGAASSAAAGEIDELVTTLLGVTCTNPTAAIGVDEQAPSVTVQQCRDKLDSLSPNGPKGAYAYVARNPDLTGTNVVTRVRTYDVSDTGEVYVYLAGASGAVSPAVRMAVENAIMQWATPLCITPFVASATNVAVPVTYTIWIYQSVNKTVDEIKDVIQTALESLFSKHPIGGDIIPPATTGHLYASIIESTIRETFPQIFRINMSLPVFDIPLANNSVAVLGTVTGTVNIVTDPR